MPDSISALPDSRWNCAVPEELKAAARTEVHARAWVRAANTSSRGSTHTPCQPKPTSRAYEFEKVTPSCAPTSTKVPLVL
jgi:hypothetical protein